MDIIKNLCNLIDRLSIFDTKIYITSTIKEYVIYLDDNTFIITSIEGDILFENLRLLPFLQWINSNIFDITLIELDLNLSNNYQKPIVFYKNESIENPYNFIKGLIKVIERLIGIEAKVYITAMGKEYVIYIDDNTFIITSVDKSIFYENDNLILFLKWININIFNITLIELDLNLTQRPNKPIVFYNCDKPGCYHSSKERVKAARAIQKYAIPRYNNPQRPEVKERLLREFRSMSFGKLDNSFGKLDNSEPLEIIKNTNADNIIVYLQNNNYFLNKNTDGSYHFTDDDETIDTVITLTEFIKLIKNKIITAIDLDDKNVWIRSYIDEKEETMDQIKNRCITQPLKDVLQYQEDCAICLEPLVSNKKICKPNNCEHYFHCNCWNKYKKKLDKTSVPCPSCRVPSITARCVKTYEFGKTSELKYLRSI